MAALQQPLNDALGALDKGLWIASRAKGHELAYANPAFCKLIGCNQSSIIGRPWYFWMGASDATAEDLLQAAQSGRKLTRTIERYANGQKQWLQVTVTPLPANSDCCLGTVEDVTADQLRDELQQLVNAGVASSHQGITIVEVAGDANLSTPRTSSQLGSGGGSSSSSSPSRMHAVQSQDSHPHEGSTAQLGRIVYCNHAFEHMTGRCSEELLGSDLRVLLGSNTDPDDVLRLEVAILNQEPVTLKLLCYHKSGATFWDLITVSPIQVLPQHQPRSSAGVCSHRLNSFNSGEDLQQHAKYSSPNYDSNHSHAASGAASSSSCSSDGEGSGDDRNSNSSCSYLHTDSTLSMLSNNNSIPSTSTSGNSGHQAFTSHFVTIYHNTSRWVADTADCRLRDHALSSCSEGITIVDPSLPDAPIVYCNDGFLALTGYSREEVLGRNCRFLQGADTNPEAVARIRNAVIQQRKCTVHVVNYRKDGSRFWNLLSVTPVFSSKGRLVSFIGIQSNISELMPSKEEPNKLLEAKTAAETATDAKTMFLANMSHEIRTPLNGIMATTQLLLGSVLTPEQRELAETILESGNTLLGILGDILDFSKLDHGSIALQKEPMCLRRTTEACIELVAAEALKKGLSIAYTIDDKAAERELIGDPIRIRQVLANMLSNAVKFTEHGEVVVDVRVETPATPVRAGVDRIHISVRDTGIGIAENTAGELFQMFRQAQGSMSRRYGGTGLGLAISRRLAEMMQGTIWVDSTLGQGSTFHFTLLGEWANASQAASQLASPLRTPTPQPTTATALSPPNSPISGSSGKAVQVQSSFPAAPINIPSSAFTTCQDGYCMTGSSSEGDLQQTSGLAAAVASLPAQPSSPGGSSNCSADSEFVMLLGRKVLVDVAHRATAQQMCQSCRHLGMIPERADASTPTAAASYDVALVDVDRAAAALKAGWKGRPLVALGTKEELPLVLQPLVVLVPLPAKHFRLATALVKSTMLLKWSTPHAGPKLGNEPISYESIKDFKNWRLRRGGVMDDSFRRTSLDNSALDRTRVLLGGLGGPKVAGADGKQGTAWARSHAYQPQVPGAIPEHTVFMEPEETAQQRSGSSPSNGAAEPLRILIAEDNKVNQKVVLKVLQKIVGGCQPDVVENGLQVLKAVEEKVYDIILMDIHMPEMDGLEATKHIVARFQPEERPRIIALSADTLQALHDRCREAGIEEFIVKPFRVEDLKRVFQVCNRVSRRGTTPHSSHHVGMGMQSLNSTILAA